MRVVLVALFLLTSFPIAHAAIPASCSWTDPASVCASEANDDAQCWHMTRAEVHTISGFVEVRGTDTCGYQQIQLFGSSPLTGFFAVYVEGSDGNCHATIHFVLNVIPPTDCSAAGSPPNPGWGHLLP
jgi:hypothetical protein